MIELNAAELAAQEVAMDGRHRTAAELRAALPVLVRFLLRKRFPRELVPVLAGWIVGALDREIWASSWRVRRLFWECLAGALENVFAGSEMHTASTEWANYYFSVWCVVGDLAPLDELHARAAAGSKPVLELFQVYRAQMPDLDAALLRLESIRGPLAWSKNG